MTVHYIDLDSTYRNRNEWPSSAEFSIPVSTSGRNPPSKALDPVCLSAPITTWKSKTFNTEISSSVQHYGTVQASIDKLSREIINNNFTVVIKSINNHRFQKKKNYYQGATCIVFDSSDPTSSQTNGYRETTRITSYKYIRTIPNENTYELNVDVAEISVTNPIRIAPVDATSTNTNIFMYIIDSTSMNNPCFPIVFVPAGILVENAYPNHYLHNDDYNTSHKITYYHQKTNTVEVDINKNNSCTKQQNDCLNFSLNQSHFCIRQELPLTVNLIKTIFNKTKIVLQSNQSYDNAFIRIVTQNQASSNQFRKILRKCCVDVDGEINNGFEIESPFDSDVTTGTKIEILPISYDNLNPFRYNSTWSQTDSCYEIRINSLTLPNAILNVFTGGNIAFYPYIYVELSSDSLHGKNMNVLCSNNPNSYKALFRIPIYDTTNPYSRPFVIVSSDPQVVKFNPCEAIKIAIRMENGELFNTVLEETYSPLPPNPYCQIRALISIRKL
jgi:hypothetical protein